MQNEDTIEVEDIESEIIDDETDNASYKINTYGADYTLELLTNKLKEKEIIIPNFQRKYVWTPKKASKLIESFLLGLPVPQIFLYRESDTQNLLVVDGQQRLSSSLYFFNEKFDDGTSFKLKGVKSQWEGKSYADLEESDQRKLRNYILRATIFEQLDPADNSSVFEIFERLNTGGTSLTSQEIRNCVIRGNISDLFSELNLDKSWRQLLSKELPDKRMKDVEMILRFFALIEKWEKYKNPMKDFMTDYMERNSNLSEVQRSELNSIFHTVMSKIHDEVGVNAFKLKSGINVAAFDAISVAVAICILKQDLDLNDIKPKIESLKKDPSFIDYVSKATTNEDSVKGRIKMAIRFLSEHHI